MRPKSTTVNIVCSGPRASWIQANLLRIEKKSHLLKSEIVTATSESSNFTKACFFLDMWPKIYVLKIDLGLVNSSGSNNLQLKGPVRTLSAAI